MSADRPRLRRRPLLFLIRHYLGLLLLGVGDWIQGDYRYETISGPDWEGKCEARPVPARWGDVLPTLSSTSPSVTVEIHSFADQVDAARAFSARFAPPPALRRPNGL